MIKISPRRIVKRKKRAMALMVHYSLMACFALYRLLSLRPTSAREELDTSRIKKILLVRIDGLGDVVMSTPVFGPIRGLFPDAHITLLTGSWSKGLVEVIPDLDEIIYFDAPWMVKGRDEKRQSLLSVAKRLRGEGFDLAIDFRGDFRNNILMYLSNATYRLGFNITGCGFLLTHVVPCSDDHHSTKMCISMIKYLNPGDDKEHRLSLWTTEEDREYAANLLKKAGVCPSEDASPVVIIHPGAKWYGRCWMPERYAEIADRLVEKYGARVLLSGAPADAELTGSIAKMMKHKAILTAGRTSLRQFLALLDKSFLLSGVDSGPMHMAVAMRTRMVALFGPTSSEAWGPSGDEHTVVTRQNDFTCSPCAQTRCSVPEDNCMMAITTEDVWGAVRRQMEIMSHGERNRQSTGNL
ncbi:MAG: glycosyltransferase family 9 protein [Thermodesulfobacteriota bacterium]